MTTKPHQDYSIPDESVLQIKVLGGFSFQVLLFSLLPSGVIEFDVIFHEQHQL